MTKRKIIIICVSIFSGIMILFQMIWLVTSGRIDPEYYYSDEMGTKHKSDNGYDSFHTVPSTTSLYEANTLHVRFIERKHNFGDSRTEYVFEVVEWLHSEKGADTSSNKVSFYADAYPLKYKSTIELREINYGYTYENGKEYVIIAYGEELNDFYLSLDNLSNMDRSDLADFNALNENFTNMKKDEVLLFLKSWIAENAE